MMSVIVRDLLDGDIFNVSELIQKNYRCIVSKYLSPEIISFLSNEMSSEKYINGYLTESTKQMFVLENNDVLSGIVSIVLPESPEYSFNEFTHQLPQIKALVIYPEREGCGELLVEHIEQYVMDKGYLGIVVEFNLQSEEFYKKMGYEIVSLFESSGEINPGELFDCPIMKKEFDV